MAMKKKSLVIDDLKSVVSTVPVGFVGYWMGTTSNIPEGWWVCNGATFNKTLYPELYKALNKVAQVPDMVSDNRFIRCSSTSGVKQGDAIRNITGWISGIGHDPWLVYYSGAFYGNGETNQPGMNDMDYNNASISFDASRVVPTAGENRPINISAIPIIKHD